MLDGGRFALAIGIGVNVVAHPDDLPYPATSLAALGADVRCRDAVPGAVRRLDRELPRLGRGPRAGARSASAGWRAPPGSAREVAVQVDGNVVRGVFETIDEDCRFVIRDDGGDVVKIAAGDVHFGAVASAGAA